MEKLFSFLEELKKRSIFFSLGQSRENAVMVSVVVPGERWEVEFFRDGAVEIEKFKSNGEIFDEKEIDSLFEKFSN